MQLKKFYFEILQKNKNKSFELFVINLLSEVFQAPF